MGDTSIEWTDKTWNPWHGCHKVSPGCKNCYMFSDKKRYGQDPNVVTRSKTLFDSPLKWPQVPTMCFTCSWSDWLIEEADPWREEAYDIIRRTPWITYQILTKRIERAQGRIPLPALPNIWFGVSIENRFTADERIPELLRTPAAVRFVSYEPALQDVDFTQILYNPAATKRLSVLDRKGWSALDWGIIGGESGPHARPFSIQTLRNTIRQFQSAQVPLFVKQMGARPVGESEADLLWISQMKDRKGGNPQEWLEEFRVREFPR